MRELEESLASAEKMKAEVADKLAEAEKKAKEGGGATLKPGTVAVSKEAADDAKREPPPPPPPPPSLFTTARDDEATAAAAFIVMMPLTMSRVFYTYMTCVWGM